ncbi:hypothetical protein [Streptosporangium amethystogenes]|uniref:hypothetical protein n=1 Tax=Streptosporangium amethystogenes TaxID=2002 RepID=UPI0004C761BE|nr:hypothetical protein [Streptosporangium amethystogenes]
MGTTKTRTAAETLDALKARILAGDETVTAEELAQTTHAAEHEKLLQQAAEILAAEQAEADRLDRVRAIAEQLLTAYDDPGENDDIEALRAAVASIVRRADRRKEAFREAYGALAREGVRIGDEPTAGISRREAAMGVSDRVVVGEQTITYVAPGRTIADAISSALGDLGKSDGILAPGLLVRGKREPRQETAEQAQRREEMRQAMLAKMRQQEQTK